MIGLRRSPVLLLCVVALAACQPRERLIVPAPWTQPPLVEDLEAEVGDLRVSIAARAAEDAGSGVVWNYDPSLAADAASIQFSDPDEAAVALVAAILPAPRLVVADPRWLEPAASWGLDTVLVPWQNGDSANLATRLSEFLGRGGRGVALLVGGATGELLLAQQAILEPAEESAGAFVLVEVAFESTLDRLRDSGLAVDAGVVYDLTGGLEEYREAGRDRAAGDIHIARRIVRY